VIQQSAINNQQPNMLIFLTGMPASGKTTTGKLLAEELSYDFLDLDDLVVTAEKMAIPAIFERKGEAYFREAEAKELRRLQGAKNTVVATGGGTPCFRDNMKWMNRHGLTVFLDTELTTLARRIEASENQRPLVAKNKKSVLAFLNETLSCRMEFYQQSGIRVKPEKMTVAELAQLVQEKLNLPRKRNK
jgi:shikimate kinase